MATVNQAMTKLTVAPQIEPQKENLQRDKCLSESCEFCGGSGWYRLDVEIGHPQFGKLIRCDCKIREDAQRLNRISGISEAERAITLDDIITDGLASTARMVGACRRFISSPRGIITIYGGSGNGKTMALQACVNAMLNRNIRAVYITAFDLISNIRAAFVQDINTKTLEVADGDSYGRLRRFESIEVLAIDEFDKVRVTDWALEQITDLIDRRYRMAEDGTGGTLIAMNKAPETLPPWIASRLKRYSMICNGDSDMRPALSRYEHELFEDERRAAFDTGERLGR